MTNVTLFGRLPEIELCLSNSVRVLSFMTAEGDPQWTLFDHHKDPSRWIRIHGGALQPEVGND